MTRMLIHAGFHKTGTSTVQKMLDVNRETLAPLAQVYLHDQLAETCNAARTFSAKRRSVALKKFAAGMKTFFQSLPKDDPRDIVISAEDLSGLMPGRRNQSSYGAAPLLMKAMLLSLEEALTEPPELIFYYSLRDPHSWLTSCHAHHVRVVRMTQSKEDFFADHLEAADLQHAVDRVRVAVAPHRIETAWLHDTQNAPLGPLQPIADLLQWPREICEKIKPVAPVNVGLPKPLTSEILLLNQSDLDIKALNRAKMEARKKWRRQKDEISET
ncbi:hypothetical protein [Shimia thalassica]|uniref:hypothetical protein n=1 Tax=Shimia thalassica TaxID=1715693 RepID=UPI0026E414FB|nr:hypothetical protein [Shimia thalassica]MDO6484539.1 hypothetical protein [Shimia thalassica]